MKASPASLTLRIISVILLLSLPGFASADVAIYGANTQTWNEEVRDTVATAAGGSLGTVDFFDAGSVTPTLIELQAYTAVMVYSDGGFADSTALGDVLADYVDAGGAVVLATFAFNAGHLGGRILTDNYLPTTVASQASPGGLTLVAIDAGHPLLAGVTTFAGGTASFHNTVAMAAGGTLIAEWSNGIPLVAVKGAVVVLNFYPPSNTSRNDFWDASTDGGILMANALGSTGAPSAQPVVATPVPVMGPMVLLFLTLAIATIGGITFRQQS